MRRRSVPSRASTPKPSASKPASSRTLSGHCYRRQASLSASVSPSCAALLAGMQVVTSRMLYPSFSPLGRLQRPMGGLLRSGYQRPVSANGGAPGSFC